MIRSAALAIAIALPAASGAQGIFDNDRFLPVRPSGPGAFTVTRKTATSGSEYFCRAGEWARRQGASYTDRVEVVASDRGGVSFRIVGRGTSSGGLILSGRSGESRSVAHALQLCNS